MKRLFKTLTPPVSRFFSRNAATQQQKLTYYCSAAAVATVAAATSAYVAYNYYLSSQQAEQLQDEDLTYNASEKKTVFADEQNNGRVVPAYLKTIEGTAPIYRIVLTGGPCAGKSSSLILLSERLRALGFQVFLVTETATMLMTGGAKFHEGMDLAERFAFESGIMKMQMALEDVYLDIAKSSGKPTILLCDRGVMDTKAYMDPQHYDSMIEANNWNAGKLRDSRYDCIVHLVSAAIGAEHFYSKATNATRREDLELARTIDLRLRESYIGHPHLYIVDNSTDFEGKINRVMDIVMRRVGAPKPIGTKRRFLINGAITNSSLTQLGVSFVETEIDQIFLDQTNQNEQNQLRKLKTKDGSTTYQVSTRSFADGKESLILRRITGKTYLSLQAHKKEDMSEIKKNVRSFVYKNHYFEIVTYLLHSNSPSDNRNITIVRVEAEQEIDFPKFLKDVILTEVTFNEKYAAYHLAAKKQ